MTWKKYDVEVCPGADWPLATLLPSLARTSSSCSPVSRRYSASARMILNVPLQSGAQLELLFAHQETNLKLTNRATGVQATLFDMAVEYFQVGGLYEAKHDGRVKAFGLGSLGVTHYNPQESGRSSEWRFSGGFGIGAKSFVSERVAIRTEARLMFTLINAAGSIFCSSGSGCLTNVQGTGVAQLLLTAGLTFKLGR